MAMEKTFNAAEAEPRIYKDWENWGENGAFAAGANAAPGAETFCIMIPPPNVTGSLHIGHAFNNTLQDILIRWHRMRGFDTLWQPGQDHAGIATQMVVEREMAANQEPSRREMGREAFVERVWQQKDKSGGTIIEQLKRLGASCDWSRNAFTMGEQGNPKGFPEAVTKVFVDMYNKGLIHKGKRLVNWDPHFETAISDLEVEQIEKNGHMWRLRYTLENGETYQHPTEFDEDGKAIAFETRDYLVVATTRPETMLGDSGIAVHPKDPRYAHLVGKTVRLPLVGRSIPIVADDYADPDKGTGAVKITPAHDFNDERVGKRAGLKIINVMTTTAAMHLTDNADFLDGCEPSPEAMALQGLDRYEARKAIIALAKAQGWLDGIDSDVHMVPHGDRSKTAIEPYLTDQWFVDTARIVQPAIDAVRSGQTKILPQRDEKVYFHWLENIEPWCISRQLWWGHQIPVWYGPSVDDNGVVTGITPQEFCEPTEDAVSEKAKAYYQERAGHSVEIHFSQVDDLISQHVASHGGNPAATRNSGILDKNRRIRTANLFRDPDVLDTWFSSGLWPIGTLGWPEQSKELEKYFPTDVLITGFDIIFFWVARMMMMQLAVVDQIPFHTVYVHALVRDESGKKWSKSTGNVLDPLELFDEYGADAVRFTLTAMAAMGRDLKLSTQRIAGYRNFGTKLWNATRFAEMNNCKPSDNFDPAACTQTVNKWIVGETAKALLSLDTSLAAYRFNDAATGLYTYVWGKVCDWYVEFAKPLLNSDDAAVVAETRATMAWIIDQCVILLHPIMPYITEELWNGITTRQKMLVHADWPTYGEELITSAADREMNWVIFLIDAVRSTRAEMHVPAGAKIPMLQLELDAAGQAAWDRNAPLIMKLARIDTLTRADDMPKGAVTITVTGGTFCLPLADIIDVDEEKSRLEKTLGKLAKDMGGLRGRLNNPKFVASAPPEVVDESRALLAVKEVEESKINAALLRLAELG